MSMPTTPINLLDLYTGKERTTVMGYNASVLSFSNALYPIIGGALAILGWNYPFLLTLLSVPVVIFTAFGLKNPEPKSEQNLSEYLKSASLALKNKETLLLYICSTAQFIILYGVYLVYIPILLAKKFGASSWMIGVMLSTMSIFTAIFAANLGKLLKYYSEKKLLKFSYICCGTALLVIPFITNLWLLFIPVAVFGIGHGLNFPNVQTLLAGLAPINYRAVFMSLNGMVLRLGQTLGPLLTGLIFISLGIGWIYFAGAILSFLIFVIIYLYLK
jgi:MFS family permease